MAQNTSMTFSWYMGQNKSLHTKKATNTEQKLAHKTKQQTQNTSLHTKQSNKHRTQVSTQTKQQTHASTQTKATKTISCMLQTHVKRPKNKPQHNQYNSVYNTNIHTEDNN
jgi:hypothetical protein